MKQFLFAAFLLVSVGSFFAQSVRLKDPRANGAYLMQVGDGLQIGYTQDREQATIFERIDMVTMQTMDYNPLKLRTGNAQLKVQKPVEAWLDVNATKAFFLNPKLVDKGSWQAVPSVWQYSFRTGDSSELPPMFGSMIENIANRLRLADCELIAEPV